MSDQSGHFRIEFPMDFGRVIRANNDLGVNVFYEATQTAGGKVIQTIGIFEDDVPQAPWDQGVDPSASSSNSTASTRAYAYTYRSVHPAILPKCFDGQLSKWAWLNLLTNRARSRGKKLDVEAYLDQKLACMEEARKIIFQGYQMNGAPLSPDLLSDLTEKLVDVCLAPAEVREGEEDRSARICLDAFNAWAKTKGCAASAALVPSIVYRAIRAPMYGSADDAAMELVIGVSERDAAAYTLGDWISQGEDEQGRSVRLQAYADAARFVLSHPALNSQGECQSALVCEVELISLGLDANAIAEVTADICDAEGNPAKIQAAIAGITADKSRASVR